VSDRDVRHWLEERRRADEEERARDRVEGWVYIDEIIEEIDLTETPKKPAPPSRFARPPTPTPPPPPSRPPSPPPPSPPLSPPPHSVVPSDYKELRAQKTMPGRVAKAMSALQHSHTLSDEARQLATSTVNVFQYWRRKPMATLFEPWTSLIAITN
jgi:outer membrane biosynthesis protein TonB